MARAVKVEQTLLQFFSEVSFSSWERRSVARRAELWLFYTFPSVYGRAIVVKLDLRFRWWHAKIPWLLVRMENFSWKLWSLSWREFRSAFQLLKKSVKIFSAAPFASRFESHFSKQPDNSPRSIRWLLKICFLKMFIKEDAKKLPTKSRAVSWVFFVEGPFTDKFSSSIGLSSLVDTARDEFHIPESFCAVNMEKIFTICEPKWRLQKYVSYFCLALWNGKEKWKINESTMSQLILAKRQKI